RSSRASRSSSIRRETAPRARRRRLLVGAGRARRLPAADPATGSEDGGTAALGVERPRHRVLPRTGALVRRAARPRAGASRPAPERLALQRPRARHAGEGIGSDGRLYHFAGPYSLSWRNRGGLPTYPCRRAPGSWSDSRPWRI